jgi:hypothetical protein
MGLRLDTDYVRRCPANICSGFGSYKCMCTVDAAASLSFECGQARTFIGDRAVALWSTSHFVAIHPNLVLVLLLVELHDANGAEVLCDVGLRCIWRQATHVHHVAIIVAQFKRHGLGVVRHDAWRDYPTVTCRKTRLIC